MSERVYVRLKFDALNGPQTVWAEKLGRWSYRQLTRDGQKMEPDRIILCAAGDVLSEQLAQMSKDYAELEITPS